jgi:Arc/MetJ family transcription regulator
MYMKENVMATESVLRHKHVRIDEAKLRKAKRILEAATDTEALDRALTVVVSEGEIDRVLREIGGKGSLKKVFR